MMEKKTQEPKPLIVLLASGKYWRLDTTPARLATEWEIDNISRRIVG